MKNIIFVILLLFQIICHAQQQVSLPMAKTAAINTMRYNRQLYTEADIDTVHLYVSGIDTLLYEVKFNDNHSVLLSGSKACQPILGYNFSYEEETALDKFDEIPAGLQCMIQEYIDQIELCFANDTITLWHATDWLDLMSFNRETNEIYDVVSPLISTKWGQSSSNDNYDCHAYNYYVPSTNNECPCDDKHNPTGCTAVAMAQIMNYWKHPVYNNSYGPDQFDWCNMPEELRTNRPSYEKERNAIAFLMRECGVYINMHYGFFGCNSFAWPSNARYALVEYYDYSRDAELQHRFWWSTNTWVGRIKNNLNHGWPVLYAGGSFSFSSGIDGHSFVCDGYRSDNTFHFNWGWNGSCNKYWLSINSLTFEGNSFNSAQRAVFYIYPNEDSYHDYCDFSMPLETYFMINILNNNTSIAVPRIFDTIASVSSTSTLDPRYRTIPASESIEYTAHKRVILRDGFHAEEGSHFISYIDECEKCEEEDFRENHNGDKKTFEQSEPAMIASNIADKVYIIPNPNQGSFYVSLSNNEDDEITDIMVFDTMGKIIYSNNRFNGGEIVLPNAKHGLYYVVVTLKDKTITEKIIIQ